MLPSWRRPEAILASPYVATGAALGGLLQQQSGGGGDGAAAPLPKRERRHLFYFNGVLGYKPMGGGDLANYSFGLRQQLYALYGNAGSEVVVTDVKTPKYDEELSTSTFCGVLPGWGWSGRMEDAVLHGCIPVILQDGVHTPWESVLDTPSYALRVKRCLLYTSPSPRD